jgi:hypothetical protein
VRDLDYSRPPFSAVRETQRTVEKAYSSDVPLQESVRAFLERKDTPEEYLEAADRMEYAAEVLLDTAGL